MNNIVTDFDQILNLAQSYNLPLTKRRAVLREYLQTKILELLYQEKMSKNLFFVGGTSLRILRGLPRFSEDLDFDLNKISPSQIDNLMGRLIKSLQRENLQLDFFRKVSGKRRYYELRFKDLLYQLQISTHKEEKLAIKFDFENIWQGHKREVILLNRYGFLVNVVSLPLDQLLVQKLTAYAKRKETQPRDIYDTVWLISQGAKIDWEFAKQNNAAADLLEQARKKFKAERKQLEGYRRKLKPFLINERNIEKLDFFAQMLENVENG